MSAAADTFAEVKALSAATLLETLDDGSVTVEEGLLLLGRLTDEDYEAHRARLKVALKYGRMEKFDKRRDAERRAFLVSEAKARADAAGKLWIDLGAPRETAEQFLGTVKNDPSSPLRVLRYHQKQWLAWNGRHYSTVEEPVVYALLDRWMKQNDCDPDTKEKGNVRDALRLCTQVLDGGEYGHWLDGRAGEWLAFENVLLNLDTGQTAPHSPEFLNLFALPFKYDPKATCPQWRKFLLEVYEGDAESAEALQRVFGWTLTRKILQQAIVLLLGERRSGKGTIGRVLRSMLGGDAVVGVDLHTLGAHFSLENVIGKRVALASESRVGSGRHANYTAALERMLTISGQDPVTAHRKGIGDWNGILEARFILQANEAPWLHDTTKALLSRLIVIPHRLSFEGREDPNLTERLCSELPGIFLWALQGLALVRESGLLRPARGEEERGEIETLLDPLAQFLEEECVIDPRALVPKHEFRQRLTHWWDNKGITMSPPPENRLTIQLRRHVGRATFKESKRRIPSAKWAGGGNRPTHVYEGLRLRVEEDE